MNYEDLLTKYMRFVVEKDEYGSDNVSGSSYDYGSDHFTEHEWKELQRLSKEAQNG